MKLLNIKTTNFKRLGSRSIDLTPGLNAITGPNGFGKTTLLEAILTCLYGTSQVRGSATSLKTRGESSPWKLEITFQVGKFFYKVSSSASTAEVLRAETSNFKLGEAVAKGRSDVTATITSLLGSAESFKFLHVIEQKDASSIAKSGGIRLQRQVEKQTGADVLLQVEEWCKAEFNRIDAIINHRHAVVEHDAEELKEKKRILSVRLDQMKSELTDVNAHAYLIEYRDSAEQELNKARSELQTWQNQRSLQENLNTKIRSAEDMLAVLHTQRDNLDLSTASDPVEIDRLLVELDEVNRQLSDAEAVDREIAKAKSEIQEYEKTKARLEGQIAAIGEVDVEGLADRLAESLDKDNTARSAADNAREKYRKQQEETSASWELVVNLRKSVKEMQDQLDGTVCPTCHQELPDAEDVKEALAGHITAEELKLSSAEQKLAADRKASEELDNQLSKADDRTRATRSDYFDLKDAHNRALKDEENLKSLRERLESLANPSADIPESVDTKPLYLKREQINSEIADQRRIDQTYQDNLRRMEELSNKIDVTLQEKLGSEAELKRIGKIGPKPDVEFFEARFKEFSKQAADFVSRRENCEFQIKSVENELRSLSDVIEKVVKEQAQISDLKHRRVTVSELVKYVKSRRSEYLGQVWSSICAEASSISRSITEGIVNDAGQSTEIDNIRREGDTFICTEGGHEVSIKELSGAQEDVAGIAVKMAVSKVLNPGSGFLIMDEPTSAMSAMIGTRCISVISSGNGQVVTVTHKEDEIRSAANVVELG